MNDRAIDKITANIQSLLFDLRTYQDLLSGKLVRNLGMTDEQILNVIKHKNREIELYGYILAKLES